jgi:hypothetical protein
MQNLRQIVRFAAITLNGIVFLLQIWVWTVSLATFGARGQLTFSNDVSVMLLLGPSYWLVVPVVSIVILLASMLALGALIWPQPRTRLSN